MKEFQYGNACGPDLWRALERPGSLPVHSLMQSWVTRSPVPAVVDLDLNQAG
ncbi:MAG: hypothetical protein U0787_13630 [Polyangia bacterium]